LIFAIGGEAGGAATVERLSERPEVDEATGWAFPSTDETPDRGEPAGRDLPRPDAAAEGVA
jgi:hypothetical protein